MTRDNRIPSVLLLFIAVLAIAGFFKFDEKMVRCIDNNGAVPACQPSILLRNFFAALLVVDAVVGCIFFNRNPTSTHVTDTQGSSPKVVASS